MTCFCISYTSCQLNITTSTVKLLFYWAYLMTYKAVYGTYPIYVVFCTSPCFVQINNTKVANKHTQNRKYTHTKVANKYTQNRKYTHTKVIFC